MSDPLPMLTQVAMSSGTGVVVSWCLPGAMLVARTLTAVLTHKRFKLTRTLLCATVGYTVGVTLEVGSASLWVRLLGLAVVAIATALGCLGDNDDDDDWRRRWRAVKAKLPQRRYLARGIAARRPMPA